MRTIRLALGTMSPFLESLVRELVRDSPDLEIARTTSQSLGGAAMSFDPATDVLLVGAGVADRAIDAELRAKPMLTVIRMDDGGRDLTIHQMRPARSTRHNAGPAELIGIIRAAASES